MAGCDPVALFAPLLPAGAAFAALAIDGPEPPLFLAEEPAVVRAVAKRRREVAFGRACARRALASLGVPPVAIPSEDCAPCWPSGITGSITHTDDLAAAAVVRTVELRSLGLDVESLAHAERTSNLMTMVTTADERARFASLWALPLAALVFSAKESIYKCLHPLGRQFLDFSDVELAIDPAGTFTVLRAKGYDATGVRGRFAHTDALVATVAVLM